MRVLHVTESIKGGIASFLDELVPGQTASYGSAAISIAVPRLQVDCLRQCSGAEIIPFDHQGRSPFTIANYIRRVWGVIRASNADLIHAHSTFAGLAARTYKIMTGDPRPIVYSPHGWSFAMASGSPVVRSLYGAIERHLHRATAAVINPSEFEQQAARARGIKERSHLIYNGIGAGQEPATGAPRPSGGPTRLLFVGRFDRQKGFDLLLGAMDRLQGEGYHLHAVGDYVLESKAVANLPNVTLTGWLPRHEIEGYYRDCDAVVMPSRWAAFGLVALEAMRRGKALVVSDNGALPELVEHGATGLVISDCDSNSLAVGLRSLKNYNLEDLGQRGRSKFEKDFTIDKMLTLHDNIYTNVLTGRSAPGDRRND